MKMKIMPITALRDTVKISEEINKHREPIIITKNGYGDFVIVPIEQFESEGRPPMPEERHRPRGPRPPLEIMPMMEHGEFLHDDPALHRPIPMMGEHRRPPKKNANQADDPLGFIRVGASSIDVKIGNVTHNVEAIKAKVIEASKKGVKVLVFQELALTGYTAGDLFLQSRILELVQNGLAELEEFSKDYDILFAVGAPLHDGISLFNCAVIIHRGRILGVVPKTHIPEYGEFYEKRYFQPAPKQTGFIHINGEPYPFGNKLVFVDESYPKLKVFAEICEDGWMPDSPSVFASLSGATLVLNLSASNEVVGKDAYRRKLVSINSAKQICGYVYASAGIGESTSDLVFSGHHLIAENGSILRQSKLFENEDIFADIDLDLINHERIRTTSFSDSFAPRMVYIPFDMEIPLQKKIERDYPKNPFLPAGEIDLERVSSILKMQAVGLATRLKAIKCQKAVVGLSGGLDSTLALLVMVESFKLLNYDLKGITAITMPCFGTSKRTHDNAVKLSEELGVGLLEINIGDSVRQHLSDLGHESNVENNAFENAQARERTQVLMDYANDHGALMVGTGDLSELCLGWCTYGGDHMSMYGVNASIPKTLVRYLCKGYAILHPEATDSLNDIIDTPISPELLSTKKGELAQKTEDLIGPYELHDFFIYHFLRYGASPKKIYVLACQVFEGVYEKEVIKKWLKVFFRRFFQNQFKRNCLPDGAKVGTVAISPRGDLRLPTEAEAEDFLKQLDFVD